MPSGELGGGQQDTGLVLAPGTYRFVFTGYGNVRAALARLPLR